MKWAVLSLKAKENSKDRLIKERGREVGGIEEKRTERRSACGGLKPQA